MINEVSEVATTIHKRVVVHVVFNMEKAAHALQPPKHLLRFFHRPLFSLWIVENSNRQRQDFDCVGPCRVQLRAPVQKQFYFALLTAGILLQLIVYRHFAFNQLLGQTLGCKAGLSVQLLQNWLLLPFV